MDKELKVFHINELRIVVKCDGDKMVKVSCIIPVYNAERYLQETLCSIIKQSLVDIEIICVDDCSNDKSGLILAQFQKRDTRIKVFHMEQCSGAAKCRNTGLGYARGKYVVFLDADDYFFPNMLKTAYEAAEITKADLVIWDYIRIPVTVDGSQESYGKPTAIQRKCMEVIADNVDEKVLSLVDHVPWNKLVKTTLLNDKKILFQDIPTNNDIFYSTAVTVNANKIVFLGKTLMAYYFGRKDSLTEKRKSRKEHSIMAYSYTYNYILHCQGIKITEIEYLNRILESIQSFMGNPDYDESTKRQKIYDLKNDSVLYDAMLEHKENSGIKLCNRVFIDRIAKEQYIIGENYFFYYIDELKKLWHQIRSKNRKIALWGCGRLGKRFLDMLQEQEFSVDYVVDNDEKKQGQMYKGHKIYSYEDVKDIVDDFLVLNPKYIEDIERQAVGKRIIDIKKL